MSWGDQFGSFKDAAELTVYEDYETPAYLPTGGREYMPQVGDEIGYASRLVARSRYPLPGEAEYLSKVGGGPEYMPDILGRAQYTLVSEERAIYTSQLESEAEYPSHVRGETGHAAKVQGRGGIKRFLPEDPYHELKKLKSEFTGTDYRADLQDWNQLSESESQFQASIKAEEGYGGGDMKTGMMDFGDATEVSSWSQLALYNRGRGNRGKQSVAKVVQIGRDHGTGLSYVKSNNLSSFCGRGGSFSGRGQGRIIRGNSGKVSINNRGRGMGGRGENRGSLRGNRGNLHGGVSGVSFNKPPQRSQISLLEKFEKFANFLKTHEVKFNAIQSIENACTFLNLNLKTDYVCDELPKVYNRSIFTGNLCINGIFLARLVGCNKKELKHEVYNKALEILTKKSMAEINEFHDPGIDIVKACIERCLKNSGPSKFIEGSGIHVHQVVSDIITEIAQNLEDVSLLQVGLGKLIAYLKSGLVLPGNPIMKLEQAVMASKCGLRHLYRLEKKDGISKPLYEGKFILADTCIACSSNENEKTCKQNTYILALASLTQKSLAELLIPADKEAEEEAAEEHVHIETHIAAESSSPVVKPSLSEVPLLQRLMNLYNVLCSSAFSDNNIALLDNGIHNSGLAAMCVYRQLNATSQICSSCELYIENYLISVGHGTSKLECTYDAYNNAWDVITMCPPEEIVQNHRMMKPQDCTGPTVLEVVPKGISPNRESNIAALRRYGMNPEDKTKDLTNMVIVETGNWHMDRKLYAFSILQHSTILNGILLQWVFEPVKTNHQSNYKHESRPLGKFKCQMFVQDQLVSEHTGYGRNKTRNFAAAMCLFKLYEINDVIMVVHSNDSARWISYPTLTQEADALRCAAGVSKPVGVKTDMVNPLSVDRFIVNAANNRIDTFFPRRDAEELLFGPGITEMDSFEIQKYATSKKLCCETRYKDRHLYLAIYAQFNVRDVLLALKANGGKELYGKFQLVNKVGLPSSHDIINRKS